jgi:hypothetical protein
MLRQLRNLNLATMHESAKYWEIIATIQQSRVELGLRLSDCMTRPKEVSVPSVELTNTSRNKDRSLRRHH